jgi:hypothetical protein
MDPTSALIMGGASLASGLLGASSAKSVNKRQVGLSREQMAFQERMSSTAYQRAMADMRKAGINPIMAAKVGGASTPAGAMATLKDPYQAGINAAVQSKQMQLADANIDKVKATTAKEVATTNEIDQKVNAGYWQNVSNNLTQQDRKISTEILNIMANTSATRLSNTIKNWEYTYFKGRGYPSQVLITTMENGMKTDLYHNMNKERKKQYFNTVYTALDKVMRNADEVVQNPQKYLSDNFSPLVASGLSLILGGIFKKKMNTKTIKHKHQNRKLNRHGQR